MQKSSPRHDVQTDRELLFSVVLRSGHHAVYASDEPGGRDGQHAPAALNLLDLVVPIQDGFKACRALKADPITAKIPIVLVTSKKADERQILRKKQGSGRHVGKPYTQEQVQVLISRYVR